MFESSSEFIRDINFIDKVELLEMMYWLTGFLSSNHINNQITNYISSVSRQLFNVDINMYVNIFIEYDNLILNFCRNNSDSNDLLFKINDLRYTWKNNLAKNNFSAINSICIQLMTVITCLAEINKGNINPLLMF